MKPMKPILGKSPSIDSENLFIKTIVHCVFCSFLSNTYIVHEFVLFPDSFKALKFFNS